jgi:hypothetical protein
MSFGVDASVVFALLFDDESPAYADRIFATVEASDPTGLPGII